MTGRTTGDEVVRPYLTALAALLGAMLLYHGLVLRGLIAGQPTPLEPDAGALLLAAAGAMLLAAVTVRTSAGLAAVEMALAGVAVISLAGPDHRYLLAYGGVALILGAFAAMAATIAPALSHQRPTVDTARPAATRGNTTGLGPPPHRAPGRTSGQPTIADRVAAQQALRRVATARGRQQAARRAWHSWRAAPPPAPQRQRQPQSSSVLSTVVAEAEGAGVGENAEQHGGSP